MASRSLGTLTLDLVAKIGGFTEPLEKAQRTSKKQMRQMEKDAKAAAAGIAAVTAATAAAGVGVVAYTHSAAQQARELKNQSNIANATVEEFQRLSYASNSVGIAQDKLSDILKDVNDRVGDFMQTGGGPMADFFETIAPQIGVTAEQFRNLSGPQALQLYYDSLQKANLSHEDLTFYMEAMASDTSALIPLLKNGGAGFSEWADEADRLGIVLSETRVDELNEFAAQFDRITGIMSAAGNVAAAELAPALSDIADELVEIAIAFQDGEYSEQIELLTKIGTVAGTAAGAYVAYRGAVAAATIAQWAFNAAASANPIGLIVSVAGAAVGGLYAFREELGLAGNEAYQSSLDIDGLADAFQGLTEAQQENRRAAIVGDLVEMRLEAAKLGAELSEVSELVRNSGQLTEQGGAMPIASAEDVARGRELRGELDKLVVEIGASSELLAEYDAIMADVGETTRNTSARTREQIEAAEELEKAYRSIVDRIRPLQATQRKYAEEKATLVEYALRENLATAELQSLLRDLKDDYRNAENAAEVYGFTGEEANKKISDSARELGFTFSSAFEDAIVKGEDFRDVLDGISKDILRIAVRKTISEPFSDAIAGFDWGSLFGGGQSAGQTFGSSQGVSPAAIDSAISVSGIAHQGIDRIPKEGTWLLDTRERVLSAPQADKLDQFLAKQNSGGYAGPGLAPLLDSGTTVQIIDQRGSGEKAQVEESRGVDGRKLIKVLIRDEMKSALSDGSMDRPMANSYGVRRRS